MNTQDRSALAKSSGELKQLPWIIRLNFPIHFNAHNRWVLIDVLNTTSTASDAQCCQQQQGHREATLPIDSVLFFNTFLFSILFIDFICFLARILAVGISKIIFFPILSFFYVFFFIKARGRNLSIFQSKKDLV